MWLMYWVVVVLLLQWLRRVGWGGLILLINVIDVLTMVVSDMTGWCDWCIDPVGFWYDWLMWLMYWPWWFLIWLVDVIDILRRGGFITYEIVVIWFKYLCRHWTTVFLDHTGPSRRDLCPYIWRVAIHLWPIFRARVNLSVPAVA